MGKISAQPHRSRARQTAATARPPGFSARRISRSAATGSGTSINPTAQRATSDAPSGTSRASASMRLAVTQASWRRAASSRTAAAMASEMSVASRPRDEPSS